MVSKTLCFLYICGAVRLLNLHLRLILIVELQDNRIIYFKCDTISMKPVVTLRWVAQFRFAVSIKPILLCQSNLSFFIVLPITQSLRGLAVNVPFRPLRIDNYAWLSFLWSFLGWLIYIPNIFSSSNPINYIV